MASGIFTAGRIVRCPSPHFGFFEQFGRYPQPPGRWYFRRRLRVIVARSRNTLFCEPKKIVYSHFFLITPHPLWKILELPLANGHGLWFMDEPNQLKYTEYKLTTNTNFLSIRLLPWTETVPLSEEWGMPITIYLSSIYIDSWLGLSFKESYTLLLPCYMFLLWQVTLILLRNLTSTTIISCVSHSGPGVENSTV